LGPDAEAENLGYNFVNFPIQYTAEQALYLDKTIHPIVDVGCHPKSMYMGVFVLDKPVVDDPASWVFYILSTWPKEKGVVYEKDDDLLPEFRKRMEGWADPFKKATEWIPDGTKVRPVLGGLRVFAPKEKWDNKGGRVTLAGDAAHSMTFHRGQGGNNALRDAERFVSAILEVRDGKKTLVDAVDGYDEEVLTRGAQEVEMSAKQTHAFHDHAAFLQSPIMKHGIRPSASIEDKSAKT
jgi:FAD binding domain